MSWLQFHFKCRFYLQKLNQGASIQQAASSFEEANFDELYSEKESTNLQKELFNKITSLVHNSETIKALKVFSSLNLSESLTTSKTNKNITEKLSYLEAITAVFLVFITIYKFFVYPVFFELIQQHPSLNSQLFTLFPSMWFIGLTIALLTFVFTFSYRKHLKNIDAVVINQPSKAMKIFTPKNVLTEMQTLHQIITLPLGNQQSDNLFNKKMNKIIEVGLDESVELSYLYQHHAEKLDVAIWSHAQRMFGFMYALMTISIGFYIMQVYEPIFKLGALIE
jgi:hypothetical protein